MAEKSTRVVSNGRPFLFLTVTIEDEGQRPRWEEVHMMGARGIIMQPQPISLLMSNVETIPGRTIVNALGLVSGSTVRAKHVGKDILAGFKNFVGGELTAYTELLNESRNEAMQRMMLDAHNRGANAIVNVRFATSSVTAGASELFVYGTAVVVE